jgi:hypothetical protein
MNRMRTLSAIVAGVLCISSLPAAAHDDDDDNDRGHAANPALIRARQKFFGIENVDRRGRVDKEKVIFSWATNTTYVVSAAGRVVLLDSYINRPELPTRPWTSAARRSSLRISSTWAPKRSSWGMVTATMRTMPLMSPSAAELTLSGW